jgi:hypothetical protein
MACQQRRNSQSAAAGAGLDDAELRFSRYQYQYRCANAVVKAEVDRLQAIVDAKRPKWRDPQMD